MSNILHGLSIDIETIHSNIFLSLKATGKLTHEDYQTITPLLNAALQKESYASLYFEKKGLVQRNVAPNDKRIWIFSINDKGLKLFDTIQAIHENMVSELYQNLTNKEIKQLTQILEIINI